MIEWFKKVLLRLVCSHDQSGPMPVYRENSPNEVWEYCSKCGKKRRIS